MGNKDLADKGLSITSVAIKIRRLARRNPWSFVAAGIMAFILGISLGPHLSLYRLSEITTLGSSTFPKFLIVSSFVSVVFALAYRLSKKPIAGFTALLMAGFILVIAFQQIYLKVLPIYRGSDDGHLYYTVFYASLLAVIAIIGVTLSRKGEMRRILAWPFSSLAGQAIVGGLNPDALGSSEAINGKNKLTTLDWVKLLGAPSLLSIMAGIIGFFYTQSSQDHAAYLQRTKERERIGSSFISDLTALLKDKPVRQMNEDLQVVISSRIYNTLELLKETESDPIDPSSRSLQGNILRLAYQTIPYFTCDSARRLAQSTALSSFSNSITPANTVQRVGANSTAPAASTTIKDTTNITSAVSAPDSVRYQGEGCRLPDNISLRGVVLRGFSVTLPNCPRCKRLLEGADLTDADLAGSDLGGASLLKTNFRGANVTKVKFDRHTIAKLADFRDTNFSEALIDGTDFRFSKLSAGVFKGATFFIYEEEQACTLGTCPKVTIMPSFPDKERYNICKDVESLDTYLNFVKKVPQNKVGNDSPLSREEKLKLFEEFAAKNDCSKRPLGLEDILAMSP